MTNRPLYRRANGNSAIGRRVRDLYRAFMARLDNPTDPISQASVLNAAELTVALEQQRLAAARGEPVDLTQLVKLSNLVARTTRTLGLRVAPAPKTSRALAARRERWAQTQAAEAKKAEATAKATMESPDGRTTVD